MQYLSGIYKIANTITGDFYIGSAVNFRRRWRYHRYTLGTNRHHNTDLQRDWNNLGADSFEFKFILYCDIENLLYYEDVLIKGLKPSYNIRQKAGSNLGIKLSEEAKHKMREAWKTRPPMSDETRKLMSDSHKGKHHTKETCKRLSEVNKGKHLSEKTKQKMSRSATRRWSQRFETQKGGYECAK